MPQWQVDDDGGPQLPDLLVLDLDPGPETGLAECCAVAERLGERLEADGLDPVVKTSGSQGHAGLRADRGRRPRRTPAGTRRRWPQELVRGDARTTVVWRMEKVLRPGKVLIDWSQNNAAKTTVAPYSLRARPGATVSTPIGWDEVDAVREGARPGDAALHHRRRPGAGRGVRRPVRRRQRRAGRRCPRSDPRSPGVVAAPGRAADRREPGLGGFRHVRRSARRPLRRRRPARRPLPRPAGDRRRPLAACWPTSGPTSPTPSSTRPTPAAAPSPCGWSSCWPACPQRRQQLEGALSRLARQWGMTWRLTEAAHRPTLAVFVSKTDHVLQELIYRVRAGDLRAEIACVVSNHRDLEPVARGAGIPFHHVPVTPETKAEAEAAALELLGDVDLVVLARYMQIVSADSAPVPGALINIHHSFLPAFVGANPYQAAHDRGREADRGDRALRDRRSSTPGRSSSRRSPAWTTARRSRTCARRPLRRAAGARPGGDLARRGPRDRGGPADHRLRVAVVGAGEGAAATDLPVR